MAELSGKTAKIRYTSVSNTSSTDNAATLTSSTAGDFVQIDSTTRRHWDRNESTAIKLFLNSTEVGSTNYDINFVQGKFEFRSTGQAAGTYTIDTVHLTNTYLTGGREWSADVDVDMLDTTTFSTSTGDVQWRTFRPGLSEWSADIERLWSTGDTGPVFFDRLSLPSDVIVELVTNDFQRFEGYGRIESDGVQTSIDDLTVESITIRGDGELYESSS